jgi:hypothetical protein
MTEQHLKKLMVKLLGNTPALEKAMIKELKINTEKKVIKGNKKAVAVRRTCHSWSSTTLIFFCHRTAKNIQDSSKLWLRTLVNNGQMRL